MYSPIRTATLKTASTGTANPETVSCLFHEFEGKRLILQFESKPLVSGPVSVEYNDALFLGEIVRSGALSDGIWQMEVLVDQILTGLESLLRFRAQLVGEGVGPAPQPVPYPVYARTA